MAVGVVRKLSFAFLALAFCLSQSGNSFMQQGYCAAITNPAFKFVKEDAKSGIKEYRLNSNGLTVLLQERHNSPVVTVLVVYKVGSRNEAVGYTGSTHFLEHMMFKGTQAHDPLKGTGIDDVLKPVGGLNNATTSFDRTNYFEVVPSKNLSLCLEFEADRMRNALLRDSDRKSEMTVVRNELERGENSAEEILSNQVYATAFREHPYHHPVIGWRSDVEGVPSARLRQFFKEFYYPNNAALIVIGDFNTTNALAEINKYFSKVPASAKPFPHVYTQEPPQEGERRFVVQRGDEMPKAMIAYHIPAATNKDTYPLEVLASVLGDQSRQSSRLYKNLVDSGLASQAYAYNSSMKDPGLFSIYASATSGTELEKIEKAIEEELEKLGKEPVSDTELDRAKKAVWKKMKLDTDDPMRFAMQLSEAEAVAGWQWLLNMEKNIKAVTASDLQRVAKKYFAESNRTVGYYRPKNREGKNEKAGQGEDKSGEKTSEKNESHASQIRLLETSFTELSTAEAIKAEDSDVKAGVTDSASFRRDDAGMMVLAAAAVESNSDRKKTDGKNPAGVKKDAGKEKKPADKNTASKAASNNGGGMIASKTRSKTFANGMKVLVLPVRGSGVVAVSCKFKGGESIADENKTLAPELLADMLNKGSKDLSKEALADTLETMGCSLDSYTRTFWAELSSKVVTEDLDRLLSVLSESVRNPLLASEELEKLKKQKEADLKDSMVDTDAVADNKMSSMLYSPGCVYYAKPFEEQLEELKKISNDDLKALHKKQYSASNLVMALVGDIDYEEAFKLAEKHFAAWEKGQENDMSVRACRGNDKAKGKELVSRLPDKSSVSIVLANPCDVSIHSKDFCAAQLANSALGHDTIASRLAAVREKHGLTYGIRSGFSEIAQAWASWEITLTVNPENKNKALQLVRSIVKDFNVKGMTAAELQMEKQRLSGEYIVYRMRTPSQLAESLSRYATMGLGPEFMDHYPAMLQSVSLKEANDAIGKYMKLENLSTSIAGTLSENVKNK